MSVTVDEALAGVAPALQIYSDALKASTLNEEQEDLAIRRCETLATDLLEWATILQPPAPPAPTPAEAAPAPETPAAPAATEPAAAPAPVEPAAPQGTDAPASTT